jgi:hypothetical protein
MIFDPGAGQASVSGQRGRGEAALSLGHLEIPVRTRPVRAVIPLDTRWKVGL